ncbi:MAG: peptidoglycan editing factor PgeF [Oscillospiraceae bacterium]|jgi:YfiH family protein|nr:peptidoglycan editing factor PgeF [Oscillospiraceae bacterium]
MLACHLHGTLKYYTAPHFDGVRHAFSTRQGGVSLPPFDTLNLGRAGEDPRANILQNFERLCGAIKVDMRRLVFARQVHGDTVRRVTAADAGEGLYRPATADCDALVTNDPGVCLTVFSADCVPILLYDPEKQAVGAVHAGWRGTALGIVRKTVETLGDRYGCRTAHLRAAVGPCIGPCCFETRADVAKALAGVLGASVAPYIRYDGGDRFHIDLREINIFWLTQAGVPRAQIELSEACTHCRVEDFFSYRRDGARHGSMAAFIQLNPPLEGSPR